MNNTVTDLSKIPGFAQMKPDAYVHIVLDYLWDKEFESFTEFVAEGNNPENHIFYTLVQLSNIFGFEKEFDARLEDDED
jgi:hypothetical protein